MDYPSFVRSGEGRGEEETVRNTRRVFVVLGEAGVNDPALQYGGELARRMEAGLEVLGIVDLPPASIHWVAMANRLQAEGKAERMREDLSRLAASWKASGVSTAYQVAVGDPAAEVRSHVRKGGPFIAVVVGALGRITEDIVGRLHREIDYPVVTLAGRSPAEALAYARLGTGEPSIQQPKSQPRPTGKMLAFGLLSLWLYALVFWKQDALLDAMSRGRWYAALPIVTVFLFSFVHGAFANYLWKVLGIRAKRRR